ncbi:MAG: BatA and WFA domain-containing protein [Planctomycetota bacterium]|nr:BatA and WFA domain-containing protein [Planctomycetota bacterium]
MSLLNPALIFGLAFAAIPVVLHLMMRAKPKKLLFPALRLIQKRRRQNVRRIRLQHLWLLLLRVFVLAILVVSLMRPSLPAAPYGLKTGETLTLGGIVAAALAVYFAMLARWRKQGIANHLIASRRTSLRGALGVIGLALLLLFIVWPYKQRIAAAITAPLPEVSPDLPVAAIFLFDTSLSMEYRQEGRTRLDEVKSFATEHLSALPRQSRIAIADSSGTSPILFQADVQGAKARIESLETTSSFVPLNDRLRAALRLQEEDHERMLSTNGGSGNSLAFDRLIREVYIFTDLARSAWTETSAKLVRGELERLPWASVYLIDAGVNEPRNVALTSLKLSAQEVTGDSKVVVEASVVSQGFDGQEVTVEFYTHELDAEPVERGQMTVTLDSQNGQPLQFVAEVSNNKAIRGEIRLVISDPLSIDNRLWLTVGTRPPVRVLVVAPARDNTEQAIETSQAFALVTLLKALRFEVTFLAAHDLETADLAAADVVALLNVPAPSIRSWNQLHDFVRAGGGLLGFLGSAAFDGRTGIDSVAWNVPSAQEVLPGKLNVVRQFRPEAGLDVKDTSHPVLAEFDRQGDAADVAMIPVWKCWHVIPAEGANVLARFTDERASPAIIERPQGHGRAVLFATAGNLEFDEQRQWNLLVGKWPFVMLVNRLMLYLSGRTDAKFNFYPKEPVVLENDHEKPVREYLMRKPTGPQLPGSVDPDTESIWIDGANELGHYLLRPRPEGRPISFSVNHDSAESDFSRVSTADLDNLLGEGKYSVARDVESLTRSVTAGRLGVEVFPVILGIVLIFFCLELLSANRFYIADQNSASAD